MAVSLCLLVSGKVVAQAQTQTLQVVVQAEGRLVIPYGGSLSLRGIVKNAGGTRVPDVMLTTSQRTGWTVKLVPETIESLGPGEERAFSLTVTPPRTIFGEEQYFYILVSGADGTRRGYSDGFVAVLNPWKIWASVGAILAVVVVACFILVYRRISRN